MTIQEQFRQDLHKALDAMPVNKAVQNLIKGNPILYSYDLAAQVIGIEESKLRDKTKKR